MSDSTKNTIRDLKTEVEQLKELVIILAEKSVSKFSLDERISFRKVNGTYFEEDE